jgi:hypothetical protein
VDDLQKDIDKLKKQIKDKQTALGKCKPYEVARIAQLTADIAVKTTEKMTKETAKTAATTTLNIARAAVTQATSAANQAINVATQQLNNANAALNAARQQLANIQNQLLSVAQHASLNVLNNVKAAKNAAVNQAQADLNAIKSAQSKALGLASFISLQGLGKSIEIKAATFGGKISAVKGGKVNLTVIFSLLKKPEQNVSVLFDFKNPAAGFTGLLTKIKTLI